MVNIVSRVPHPSVVKEVICRNCGSTLTYTPVDIKQIKVSDYGGGVDVEHVIECPVCNHKIGV
jgi:DNA-directed RNA polymerase subunit RPC12/RpoP